MTARHSTTAGRKEHLPNPAGFPFRLLHAESTLHRIANSPMIRPQGGNPRRIKDNPRDAAFGRGPGNGRKLRRQWIGRIGIVLVAAVVGFVSASAGFARKSEAGLDAKTAAVNGGGAKAPADSSSSSPASQAAPPAPAPTRSIRWSKFRPLWEHHRRARRIGGQPDRAEFPPVCRPGHYDPTIFHQVSRIT